MRTVLVHKDLEAFQTIIVQGHGSHTNHIVGLEYSFAQEVSKGNVQQVAFTNVAMNHAEAVVKPLLTRGFAHG